MIHLEPIEHNSKSQTYKHTSGYFRYFDAIIVISRNFVLNVKNRIYQ